MPQHGAPAGRLHQLQPRLRPGGAAPGLLPAHLPGRAAQILRFAQNVWGIPREGRSDQELALAGISALAAFIREIGLPTTLKELGADKAQLRQIADSCGISQGSYKKMTHDEIYKIFCECYE